MVSQYTTRGGYANTNYERSQHPKTGALNPETTVFKRYSAKTGLHNQTQST